MKRIGLFGGSFDPVHLRHLELARTAREHLQLDELRWLPTGHPYHRAEAAHVSDAHRLAMLRLAIAGEARFVIDERELHRAGPTYTIDTVVELQAEHPQAELLLLIGQDQYAKLHAWHRWQELLSRVTLVVAGRSGEAPHAAPEVAAYPHRLVVLPLPATPESASDVRERLGKGQGIEGLVPPAVASYIARHALYQPRTQRGASPNQTS
jgi:nicotinate-nucleotide adenylyltransferase